jgi:hypothetical protein
MRLQRDCREIEPMLWNYAARTLPEENRERVESHLDTCPACSRQAEEYRITVRLTADFRDAAVPDSEANWNDLLARMEARAGNRAPVPARRPRFALTLWGGAAMAAVVIAVFFLLPRTHSKSGNEVAVIPNPPAPLHPSLTLPLPGGGQGRVPSSGKRESNAPLITQSTNKDKHRVASVSPLPVRATSPSSPSQGEGREGWRGAGGEGTARTLHQAGPSPFPVGQRPRPLPTNAVGALLAAPSKGAGGLGNLRRKQAKKHVAQNNNEKQAVPEKMAQPETYAVDGERPAGSDLSQHFVAYTAPSGESAPGQRTYVIDSIPVSASSTRHVSAGSEARELQAW